MSNPIPCSKECKRLMLDLMVLAERLVGMTHVAYYVDAGNGDYFRGEAAETARKIADQMKGWDAGTPEQEKANEEEI